MNIKRFYRDLESYYDRLDYEGARKFLEEKETELKYEVAPDFVRER